MPTNKHRLLPLQSLINNSSDVLANLYARASQISNVQLILRGALGPPLSNHLNVANYNQSGLTIYTDSPAWAARLRFKIPNILKIAREQCNLTNLLAVRIKIVIPDYDDNTPKRKISLSNDSSFFIRSIAESTTDDTLRCSLLKLSKHNT